MQLVPPEDRTTDAGAEAEAETETRELEPVRHLCLCRELKKRTFVPSLIAACNCHHWIVQCIAVNFVHCFLFCRSFLSYVALHYIALFSLYLHVHVYSVIWLELESSVMLHFANLDVCANFSLTFV